MVAQRRDKMEYEDMKDMLDARKHFSDVHDKMTPADMMDTWLAKKERSHAKRSVVQPITKVAMKQTLADRAKVSAQWVWIEPCCRQ